MASTLVPAQTTEPLSTEEVLATLAQFQAEHADEYQITRLGIFGPAVRGFDYEENGIGVVAELVRPTLFTLGGIKVDLEEVLSRPVDLVYYSKQMDPALKHRLDQEAIYA